MIKLTILLLYLVAAASLVQALSRDVEHPAGNLLSLGLGSAFIALMLHSWQLWQALIGAPGLNLQLGNIVSLLGWQLGVFAWTAAAWTRLRGLAALSLPLPGVAALFTVPALVAANSAMPGWQLKSHVVLSLLAYGLLTLAAYIAVLMQWQEQAIRRGRSGRFLRLMPPLEASEQGLFACLLGGFFLLSMAIFSGLIFVEDLLAQHLVHKTVLSLVAWLVFATLLFGRWRFGWRGARAANWTLGGFVALLLAYFGSRLVLEVILGRQWG